MAKKLLQKIKNFPKKKRRIFIGAIALSVLLLAAGTVFLFAFPAYYIKMFGVKLQPSQDFAVRNVPYYLQNDPDWSGDKIGDSNHGFGGSGCLICCAAATMTDLDVPVTPPELNAALTNAGGFDGADLIWYKINEVYAEIDYSYARVFGSADIENLLREGFLPIVNVKYRGIGRTHWVVIIGAADGEFIIYDSLQTNCEPIKLSVHGRVYAYRVLVPVGRR